MNEAQVMLPWAQQIWQRQGGALSLPAAASALPAPQIDANDEPMPALEPLIGLAVMLDVLATHLRRLPTDGLILSRLTELALACGVLGDDSDASQASRVALYERAADAAGEVRAHLSEALARLASEASAPLSAPATVGAAVSRLVNATEHVIEDARLQLATSGVMKTRQA